MSQLWDQVEVGEPDACWPWTGARTHQGYGYAEGEGAHRVIYARVNGPIPAGLVIDHLCNNPVCVNPAHLEAVTRTENTRRRTHGKPRNKQPGWEHMLHIRLDEATHRRMRFMSVDHNISMQEQVCQALKLWFAAQGEGIKQ